MGENYHNTYCPQCLQETKIELIPDHNGETAGEAWWMKRNWNAFVIWYQCNWNDFKGEMAFRFVFLVKCAIWYVFNE